MAMVVRSNLNAMNANRNLSINNGQVAKSLEKLASGYAINRAGDDASGLAISEKMKAQIKGLEQASDNSQDGISLVQTAEGGMNEIHDMLNRMVELATKSSNGTIQNEVDRDAIQSEVNALREEIDRIADATNFNGIDLLNGNLNSGATVTKGETFSGDITLANVSTATSAGTAASTGTAGLSGAATSAGTATYTLVIGEGSDAITKIYEVEVAAGDASSDVTANIQALIDADDSISQYISNTSNTLVVTGKDGDYNISGSLTVSEIGVNAVNGTGTANNAAATMWTVANGSGITIGDKTYLCSTGSTVSLDSYSDNENVEVYSDTTSMIDALQKDLGDMGMTIMTTGTATITIKTSDLDKFQGEGLSAETSYTGQSLTLQVGDTYDDYNMVSVDIESMKCASLGIDSLSVNDQDSAGDAIDIIKDAINMVSTNRANLGALQNRLEYTINNLDNTAENMTSANSTIRDTDMASEMMEYTKMNVLVQSAQSMLAQANQAPQQVLSLLG